MWRKLDLGEERKQEGRFDTDFGRLREMSISPLPWKAPEISASDAEDNAFCGRSPCMATEKHFGPWTLHATSGGAAGI
jgi:hypothetical protein